EIPDDVGGDPADLPYVIHRPCFLAGRGIRKDQPEEDCFLAVGVLAEAGADGFYFRLAAPPPVGVAPFLHSFGYSRPAVTVRLATRLFLPFLRFGGGGAASDASRILLGVTAATRARPHPLEPPVQMRCADCDHPLVARQIRGGSRLDPC